MVKKLLQSVLFSVILLLSFKNHARAQWLWIDLNFDGYNGTTATVPPGIFISWNSTSPASFYTSAGNFGTNAPSYKFGNDGDYITMYNLPVIDSISFWMKGNGAPFSLLNELRFYTSPDSINYTLIHSIDSLPTSGTAITIPFAQTGGYFKIEYSKAPSGGNLAFDDFKLYSSIIIGLDGAQPHVPITVYPTPTTGMVNIKITKSTELPEVELYDMIGNKIDFGLVERKGAGVYTIDLSYKKRGFYFLKVKSNYEFVTKRITLID